MTAGKRFDRISRWLVQLKERVGWQKTVVALANKNARILWAVLTRDVAFDPDHVPETPAARATPSLQAAARRPAHSQTLLPQPDVRQKMLTTGQTGGPSAVLMRYWPTQWFPTNHTSSKICVVGMR